MSDTGPQTQNSSKTGTGLAPPLPQHVPTAPRRGRPKSWDRATVLKAMRDVFWYKGFSATTLDDLCEATGLNRPSLYNGFGEKADIYRQVLDDYMDEIRPRFRAAFETPVGLKLALTEVFNTSIAINQSRKETGLGCFVLTAALIDSLRDPEIAAMVVTRLREMEKAFSWLFRMGQEKGEIDPVADPDALAAMATAVHSAISVRMRAGEDLGAIRIFVENMIGILSRP